MIVYEGAPHSEWEEDAYLLGVSHVLTKPVRSKILNTLLDRLLAKHSSTPKSVAEPAQLAARALPASTAYSHHTTALTALRDFSSILSHTLDSQALLKRFLLLLREVIGVNRAIIFLRKPGGLTNDTTNGRDDRWLRSACAIGIEHTFLDHFALSFRTGIGGYLHRQGRILRATSPEGSGDREAAREFQLLGVEVAIPILDRESMIGVAVFDKRLTGEPYANEELALIFHMLEEVGLAIKNSWLHDEVINNHAMVGDILGQLSSGCIVVGSNLAILHANPAARALFVKDPNKKDLEFGDLSQELGSKIFTVLKTCAPQPKFRYRPAHALETSFQVTISPFRAETPTLPNAALLIIEDVSQIEKAQRLEIEASNLRLVKSMAEHLAHEIGNSLVPLSTHEQLLPEKFEEPEFRVSLADAMGAAVKRISRFANQMVFLARDNTDFADKIQLAEVIVEAFHEANKFQPGKLARLTFEKSSERWIVAGDYKALRHAFAEVMLNALQANPKEPKVDVRIEEDKLDGGSVSLEIEVQDAGSGFTQETADRAPEPFFSTRNVGLGLGLTVTRKIIENHRGKMRIAKTTKNQTGVVRISLPLTL